MARKNILLTSSLLDRRGAERMILQLARRLDRRKYNVKVICLRKETPFLDEFLRAGVDIRSFGMAHYFQAGPLRDFYRFVRREKIDLIHTHLYRDAIYGRVLGKIAGAKVVISTLHNSYVWRSRPQLWLDGLTSCWADKVVAVSEAVRNFAISREHIPSEKITVIYNGIETERFRLSPERIEGLKKGLGLSAGEPVIGSMGELTEQKGFSYLIQAAPAILREFPSTRFLVAGDGKLEAVLQEQCRRAGLEKRINFLGFRSDTPEVLGLFDIFVLPSLWEGLPVVLMEAMAAGKPIVATDVDGNVEVFGQGEAGIAVPARDPGALSEAVRGLLRQPRLREKLGNAGKERARKIFDVEIMVKKYEELYNDFLGR